MYHSEACLPLCYGISVLLWLIDEYKRKLLFDCIDYTANGCALYNCSLIHYGRVMMWELSTDLEYTSTPLSKKRQLGSHWRDSRSFWTGKLLLRYCLPRNSTERRSTTSNTLRRGGVSDISNLLKKVAMILSDATAKSSHVLACKHWVSWTSCCKNMIAFIHVCYYLTWALISAMVTMHNAFSFGMRIFNWFVNN